MEQERGHHRAPRPDQAVGDAAGGGHGCGPPVLVAATAAVLELTLGRRWERPAEAQQDPPRHDEQQDAQQGLDPVAVDVGQHGHAHQGSERSWDGQPSDDAEVDVVEPPVGDRGGDAGGHLGQVDGRRHRSW